LPKAPRRGARWADPIAWFEQRWTWFESRLITFVLLWQLAALVAWVFLNGLSESVSQSAGVVFRGALFGLAFGLAAWFGGRRLDGGRRLSLTLVALAVGLSIAPLARSAVLTVLAFQRPLPSAPPPAAPSGLALWIFALDQRAIHYFDNIKGWLQGGSTLTLMGGLRGLGTRLTLWLALLGGSLATAAGKHIHIDVVFRFLPSRLRVRAAIVNYTAAMTVCFAGAWGFFDHIAIEAYGAWGDDARSAKIERSLHAIGDHLFLTRKQLGLDLRSLPRVLKGERYDQWMTAAEWNRWLDDAGFEGRFSREQVQALRVPEDAPPHAPLVLSPAGESTPGMLARTLGLVFPFGLIVIGLRFLIRALLTLSGHLSADPDEAHKEEIRGAAKDAAGDEERGAAGAGGDA
jgi:TRAP-type C4-dicarboxylate transport system permease small subunit